ncbi:type III-B CRISPR module RAMP protein Cmr6 [Clostridium botulinum]|uniref:type III-B CRISPR module RAMP protein Cmr6 n=1 Tax=Clostridium botulinum TaxID=1491 RepID=UPI003DA241FA
MSQYKSNRSCIKHNKNIDKKDKYPIEVSKNVYRKGAEQFIFYKNLDISNFMGSKQDECNLIYSLQRNIVRESGSKKERRYLGKIETNNEKIKCIREIQRLKPYYHQSIVKEYIKSIKKYCRELNFLVNEMEGITSYRLVVGLGNPSVTETSMTLHNIYGIPYIPGQALKGITRSYFLQKYFDIEKKEFGIIKINAAEFKAKELYKIIFGDDYYGEANEKGSIIFFDAFPVSDEIIIEKDVMTPHYSNYYGKGWNPTDEFSTNPIPFYTVKNTKFNFLFALIKEEIRMNEEKIIYAEDLKNFVSKLIKEALEEHGVGAKTSVGYGYFNDVKVIEDKKTKKRLSPNDIQLQLNQINKILDKNKKHEAIMDFYANNDVSKLGKEQKSQLAKYMKECL